jgi:predicted site-specific integrase-resolvase
VLRWLQEGRIPYEVCDTGEPRIHREDVMRVIDPPEDGPTP